MLNGACLLELRDGGRSVPMGLCSKHQRSLPWIEKEACAFEEPVTGATAGNAPTPRG
jgi:hypothetical protein